MITDLFTKVDMCVVIATLQQTKYSAFSNTNCLNAKQQKGTLEHLLFQFEARVDRLVKPQLNNKKALARYRAALQRHIRWLHKALQEHGYRLGNAMFEFKPFLLMPESGYVRHLIQTSDPSTIRFVIGESFLLYNVVNTSYVQLYWATHTRHYFIYNGGING